MYEYIFPPMWPNGSFCTLHRAPPSGHGPGLSNSRPLHGSQLHPLACQGRLSLRSLEAVMLLLWVQSFRFSVSSGVLWPVVSLSSCTWGCCSSSTMQLARRWQPSLDR